MSIISQAEPPHLSFQTTTYLHITLSSPSPIELSAASPLLTEPVPVKYVAPIGELDGEHILSVENVQSGSDEWHRIERDVLGRIQDIKGVTAVRVMNPPKQRFKRGGGEL